MPNDNKLDLTIVVNGQPVAVEGNLNAPVKTIMVLALNKSGNSGQPVDNWQLRDAGGQIFDPSKKLVELGLASGTTLFLNLMAGVGG